ncbi:MAG TPA: cation diffusion facilitator family transporter [Acidimicrobiales bacterium]
MSPGHQHAHTHAPSRTGALVVSIVANAGMLVVQVVVGLVVGSLALLADSLHNASDVVALVLALIGQVLAGRPPSKGRTYGFARAEVLAALFNSAALLAITAWVVVEAIGRLGESPDIPAGPLLLVGALGIAVNGFSAWLISRAGRSLNMRAAFWHLAGDALGSFGVVVAALGIALFGWEWADAVASLLISVLIVWGVVAVLRESLVVLLEAAPRGIDPDEVTTALDTIPGVTGVHHLHLWSIDSETPALTAHLHFGHDTDLHEAQRIAGVATQVMGERFGITHTTFQTECGDHHGGVPVALARRSDHDDPDDHDH